MKIFSAQLEDNSEDIEWFKKKRIELKVSELNKRINVIKIEEIDRAIENLSREPDTPREVISTTITDADLIRVAYAMWKVSETKQNTGTQKQFIESFLRAFGRKETFEDKLSKSFLRKNDSILDQMVAAYNKEKEKETKKHKISKKHLLVEF